MNPHFVTASVQRRWLPSNLGAFLATILLWTGACSPADSPRTSPYPAAAVSGFYEGTLQSQEHGEVPFSANLRDENGSVAGTLSTPLGDFPVSQESLAAAEIALRFALDDGEVGTIAARWGDGEIRGNWKLSDDGGAIAMRRVGPPKPPALPARSTLDLLQEEWREDLRHLAAELPRRHGNAFHTVSRAAFEESVRALEAKLPSLEEHEVFAAMGRIVASVGDGHTYLGMPQSFRRYPIRLYSFGETLRITRAAAGYEHLLGGKVLRIGEMDIREAKRLVGRQIAQENEWYVLRELPWFLVHAEILHANGVVSDLKEARWTIEALSGERLTVRLAPAAPGEEVRWVSAAQTVPLYRQRPEEDLWYTLLPESRTLYVGFRGYPAKPAFRELFDEVFRFADQNPVERMVIDLRENPGGDFTKGRELLLPRLKQHPLNRKGRLFVVIGRSTLSAAMTNAADFLRETSATLVGEPTGARPNGWQETGRFTLPNSHLAISVSTQYYRFLEEDLPAVIPHQQIPLTW
ncbi:MAG TPA: hypothetical protein VG477_12525, partial [Thermoanaerobaculia bacterium]|nr:hypothetical protein [Thermoanaerobaculia bacterium]